MPGKVLEFCHDLWGRTLTNLLHVLVSALFHLIAHWQHRFSDISEQAQEN